MRPSSSKQILICMAASVLAFAAMAARAADPLPSWREGPAKQAIVAFVA